MSDIASNEKSIQPNEDDSFLESIAKTYSRKNLAKYKTTKEYKTKAAIDAKKDKEFKGMESATYSDDSIATGGFTGYSGDAENAGGAPSSDEGTSGTGGYGMFNKGAFISRRKKT